MPEPKRKYNHDSFADAALQLEPAIVRREKNQSRQQPQDCLPIETFPPALIERLIKRIKEK